MLILAPYDEFFVATSFMRLFWQRLLIMSKDSLSFRESCAAWAGGFFERIRILTADGPGVTRLGYGNEELEVVETCEAIGRELGLEIRYDRAGNLYMTLPGRDRTLPAVLSGSHADSVIMGGNYDGLAGIAAPLAAARWMVQKHVTPPRDFTVVVLRCEEQGCFGAMGFLGRVKPEDLNRRFTAQSPTLGELYASRGIDPAPLMSGVPAELLASIAAFIELHIEQGPVLDSSTFERVGLVSGIVGILMHRKITVKGARAHAGAVPRPFRHDPVKAASQWVSRLEDLWQATLESGQDMTYTVGMMNTPPKSAFNIIPNEVTLSVDIRAIDESLRDSFGAKMREAAEVIGKKFQVEFVFDDPVVIPAALSNPEVLGRLERAAKTLGVPARVMPSGAGHDAAVLASGGIPVAMIFVANQNGSHNPNEALDMKDFVLGADMIRRAVLDFE